ncbi:MAG: GNAT family N-acetyltransferase [Clostridia bacterium]|nr:GNAT family N-acetyltransferase [Clostridia bacterium]
MIKLVDESTAATYLAYCSDNPFGVRMAAALTTYGTDCRFVDFWLVYEGENIIGALSKIDGDMTVYCDCANDEIVEFICAVGAETLTGEKNCLSLLGFNEFSCTGSIMQYNGVCDFADDETETAPSIMTVCKILCECEGESIRVGQFDRFYTDLCLRVRRGTAKCCLAGDGVAIASAVTDCAAIIGGVAVKPDARKKGIGSAVVRKLISELPKDKTIYLLRLDGENEEFYKKLGFADVGSWASISRGCD